MVLHTGLCVGSVWADGLVLFHSLFHSTLFQFLILLTCSVCEENQTHTCSTCTACATHRVSCCVLPKYFVSKLDGGHAYTVVLEDILHIPVTSSVSTRLITVAVPASAQSRI